MRIGPLSAFSLCAPSQSTPGMTNWPDGSLKALVRIHQQFIYCSKHVPQIFLGVDEYTVRGTPQGN